MDGMGAVAARSASADAMAQASTVVESATTLAATSMGDGEGCKISMLLNWHTIDACFLSSIFHIRSSFTFFLACFSAFALVVSLEYVRRFQRQFDQYLRKRDNFARSKGYALSAEMEEKLLEGSDGEREGERDAPKQKQVVIIVEQLMRGLVHVVQFSISYCIMLLFMYSNGYIIISILLGALVGFALFTRDTLQPARETNKSAEKNASCC